VERFLRWEDDDPQRRDVALAVALARWFNRDLLAALLGHEAAGRLWDWLRTRPFITNHPAGYQYHQAVRTHMLRLYRRQSPDICCQHHQALADHHRACRDAVGLEAKAGWTDPVWQQHTLEETYHRLCAAPHAHLPNALDQTLSAYQENTTLARRWIKMLQEAGADSDAPSVQQWGQRLEAATTGSDDEWVGFLTLLVQDAGLPVDRQAAALQARGRVYGNAGRYESALADFDRVLELRPDDHRSLADRGQAYWLMERYDEALADFTRAIDLDPNYDWAIAGRGQTYQAMERYDEALADLNKAIDLDPEASWYEYQLAVAYVQVHDTDSAQTAFRRAIHLGTQDLVANGTTLERLFNLALYHAAHGDIERSKRLWDQAFTLPDAAAYIRSTALDELRDLQKVLPNNTGFEESVRLLTDHIATN
jgi:tetratricopeptide (TPR) repeat protein